MEFADAASDRGARVFVFQMEFDKRREAEAQFFRICVGERCAQDLKEQEAGLEVGAGWVIFNYASLLAQVEAARTGLGRAQQAR